MKKMKMLLVVLAIALGGVLVTPTENSTKLLSSDSQIIIKDLPYEV